MLDKVTYVGTILPSFPQAAQALRKLLGLSLNTKRVERVTERIGGECVAQRESRTAVYQELPLKSRCDDVPAGVTPPECCAVMVDGGRHQQVPANPESDNHWYEYKAGICLNLKGQASATDPLPNVPQFLLDEARVKKLTCEIGRKAADQPVAAEAESTPQIAVDSIHNLHDLELARATAPDKCSRDERLSPPVASREVVATQEDCHVLGTLVVARAWALGLFQSPRKAFVGDGSSWIWGLWETHFKPAE